MNTLTILDFALRSERIVAHPSIFILINVFCMNSACESRLILVGSLCLPFDYLDLVHSQAMLHPECIQSLPSVILRILPLSHSIILSFA